MTSGTELLDLIDDTINYVENFTDEKNEEISGSTKDPCSFANTHQIINTLVNLNLSVSFETKTLKGFVVINFKVLEDNVSQVILDCNGLNITSVTDNKTSNKLTFKFGESKHSSHFGKPLIISLNDKLSKSNNEFDVQIKISYSTSPNAEAIQWLEPSQTAGGKYHYLFTQCQAILARTMFPCQDSPGAKSKYIASITVPKDYVALMSALSTDNKVNKDNNTITYNFRQNVPTASYLYALVVGNLESRKISDRCCVWSEPSEVGKAEYEFANTEKLLQIAESICGKYEWGRYDLLMLPPSFPYGGMENPCLTFVTPTLIAGDRSLENVVAHEITHSWTGNLVSNETWEHFWLNEGWTRFIEGKITQRTIKDPKLGLEYRKLLDINGNNDIKTEVERYGKTHEFTKLNLSLVGIDPDDAFSSIPYEKGRNFLQYLQELVGGDEPFEKFAREYFKEYKFKSINSSQFKDYFCNYFKDNKNITQIDWDLWLRGPGMPPKLIVTPESSKLFKETHALIDKWKTNKDYKGNSSDIKDWFVPQFEMLLDGLYDDYKESINNTKENDKKEEIRVNLRNILSNMKNSYKFHESKNSEILFRWCQLVLLSQEKSMYNLAVNMVSTVGRMKFVRPLYRTMLLCEEQKKIAIDTFKKNKNRYHPICAKMVGRDLNVN